MIKHTQTIPRQQPMNCLSVTDHFVGLAIKGLTQAGRFIRLRNLCVFQKAIIGESSKLTFTCSKSTTETLEKGLRYVQS